MRNCKATVALPSSGPCMSCWRYANSVPLVESITVLALEASKSSQMDLPQHTQPRLRSPGGCIVIVGYAGSTDDYHIDVSEVQIWFHHHVCFCDICMLTLTFMQALGCSANDNICNPFNILCKTEHISHVNVWLGESPLVMINNLHIFNLFPVFSW